MSHKKKCSWKEASLARSIKVCRNEIILTIDADCFPTEAELSH